MTTSRVTVSVDATGDHPGEGFRRGVEVAVADVLTERVRQETKWGEQNHPIAPPRDGGLRWHYAHTVGNTALARLGLPTEKAARVACDEAAKAGRVTYGHILGDEGAEMIYAAAIHGDASDEVRAEAVQVAAVALAIVERIDRARAAKGATRR